MAVVRVGLTGGIGSGKSEVSHRLAAHGAVVVDADLLAREVVEPGTDGLAEVVAQLGPDVLGPDGALDRVAVGRRVFGDDEVRHRLEAVVHPLVRQRAAEIERRAADGAVVVHDIPLLVETGQQDDFDVVVVVDAPDDVRVERLVSARGMDAAEARSRITAQASRERRLAAADEVVDNAGDLIALDARVDALWQRLVSRLPLRHRP